MQHRYIPATDDDQEKMLEVVGAQSVEELFDLIPESLRFKGRLDVPEAMSEQELVAHLQELAQRNVDPTQTTSFLGAGSNRHFIPAVVPEMVSRGELLTAYTSYQAELSQGTLKLLYGFQTFMCLLTDMEVANGSMYEGATALVEAVLMAHRMNKKGTVAISAAVHPEYRQTLRTYLTPLGIKLYELPLSLGMTTWQKDLFQNFPEEDISCIIVQNPNFFGLVEDLSESRALADELSAQLIVPVTEAISLGILKPPGEYGADIVVGEGQSLGIPPQFGGPYVGFFAIREKHVMNMPGRLVGATEDVNRKRGYVITLASREQHIRRERASSNICTNETLLAIASSIFMMLAGKEGLRALAVQNLQKAAYAKEQIAALAGYDTPYPGHTFNEFVVRAFGQNAQDIIDKLGERDILAGVALSKWYPGRHEEFLVSVTDLNSRKEIDGFVEALGEVRND